MSKEVASITQETGTQDVAEQGTGSKNSPAEAGSFSPPTIYSETIAHVGNFEIRNTLLMSWISVIFLCVIAWKFSRKYRENEVPTGFQNLIETLIEGIYDFFHSVTQDAKQTKAFFGVCATIFFFVVVSNWFGIFPGVGPIGIWEEHEGKKLLVPLLRSTFSDVNMTMAIAGISVIMTQFYGMAHLGFGGYWGKFFVNPFRDPIGFGVGLLELVSEFSKIISFTFRLYGNIFAGEVLLVVIAFLAPYIAPIPFYGLELFVGLVQGLVFSLLTLVFFKMGATGHGHDDHEDVHTSAQKHAAIVS